jgi:Zn-dependent protease
MRTTLLNAIAWVIIFILSATVHEAAHAWASKRGGDPTAYLGGQVTLNPVPHIKREPLGMLIFPFITSLISGWPFGYASAPYDAHWAYLHPRRAAWMSAAGPAANLLIVVLCTIAIKIGITAGVLIQPNYINFQHIVNSASSGGWDGMAIFVSMLFSLNLILTIINFIPFPPLDGSNIISLFLHDEAARKYRRAISNPMFSIIGFIIAWQIFDPLFKLLFPALMNIVYRGSHYHY